MGCPGQAVGNGSSGCKSLGRSGHVAPSVSHPDGCVNVFAPLLEEPPDSQERMGPQRTGRCCSRNRLEASSPWAREPTDGGHSKPPRGAGLPPGALPQGIIEPRRAGTLQRSREPRSFYKAFRNSSIAAFTSAARSCCVQWPQPGSITVRRSCGTNFERFGMS